MHVYAFHVFSLSERWNTEKIHLSPVMAVKQLGNPPLLLSTLKVTHSLHCIEPAFHKKDTHWHIHVQMTQTEASTHRTAHTQRYNLQMDSRKITWPEAMALKKCWIMRHEEHLSPVTTSMAFMVTCWLGLDSALRVVRTSLCMLPLGTRAWPVPVSLRQIPPHTEPTRSAGGLNSFWRL